MCDLFSSRLKFKPYGAWLDCWFSSLGVGFSLLSEFSLKLFSAADLIGEFDLLGASFRLDMKNLRGRY